MRKHVIRLTIIVIVLLALLAFYLTRPDRARFSEQAVTGRTPQLSQARPQRIPTVRVAEPIGWADGQTPTAAAGLQVQPFAKGLDHPRWLYALANGDVLVAESNSPPREGGGITGWFMKRFMDRAGAGTPSANRITLLRDVNGDGVTESRSALLTGLNSPFGMAVVGDWLYVANTDALVRYPFRVGQTKITAAAEKIIALPGGGNHWARNVVAAPDGKSLYVSVGSASNIAENGLDVEKNRAAIWQVNPETKSFRIYATGLRNANGMAFEPRSKELWAVVNERDMIGSDMPPDYLTKVEFGGNYGWPWHYWGGYIDDRVQPQRPDLREYVVRPDYALGAHVAPLGLAFTDAMRLGDRFGNGAVVGLHGSWNRVPPSGYKVVYVPFGTNGFPLPNSRPVDLLTGFLTADGKQVHGRPVGVIADRTGAMLVADDVGNVVWRVSQPRAAR
ncbi:PQQ-dependent sugar dehydrogenase [Sphingomonas sp. Leaf25]|uniref:PQQ-dependent sugar dehydrogenase n=1 Tax=Sphingomonas sp. Leaf25 TaxID=1735692 RepID=UPI0006F78801|nr:sorbosone dehydrogenase family protein [Sphingomonas sp. Leaf25]KQN03618.1 sorbosone dehydrogenase [Sphingomonas sp. Leaf25]